MSGLDPRVTGEQAYSVDVTRPGMLHAAFVRSPHPHARVTRVDASGLPSGCVALLPEDVADLGRYGCQAREGLRDVVLRGRVADAGAEQLYFGADGADPAGVGVNYAAADGDGGGEAEVVGGFLGERADFLAGGVELVVLRSTC